MSALSGKRHLRRALGRRRRKHGGGIEIQDDGGEGGAVGLLPVGQARGVTRAVGQLELHEAFFTVERDAPLPREIDVCRRAIDIGDQHVFPAAPGREIPDVDDVIREVLKEDLGLDVLLELLRDEAVGDLAKRRIRGRQRDDDLVGGGGRANRGEQDHGAKQAHQADAAGLHRDELPVGGQPSEPHEDPQENGHGNRDAQGLRQEHVECAQDGRPGYAAGDEGRTLLEKRRHLQQERQHHQAQYEWEDHFAEKVAVERGEHRACLD
jgi:hypothetical protein